MIDGIINVYKEAGYTSFDVVAKLRGILKQKKIGHTGTLDPEAEGVLPVCLGNGTKLCELLTDKDKEYEAVLFLGRETDTQDTTGSIIAEKIVDCTEDDIKEAVKSFMGSYEQIPPMYSAIKIDGKRLYQLAREGKTVERKGRTVQIYRIDIISIELPRVKLRVNCSRGTYIRTLCNDIGKNLGCGGCMEHLLRTKSGNYRIENAITLKEIEEKRDQDRLSEIILPLDSAFNFPKLYVRKEWKNLIDNGNPMKPECFEDSEDSLHKRGILQEERGGFEAEGRYWVYNTENLLAGIYRYDGNRHILMPDKIFDVCAR